MSELTNPTSEPTWHLKNHVGTHVGAEQTRLRSRHNNPGPMSVPMSGQAGPTSDPTWGAVGSCRTPCRVTPDPTSEPTSQSRHNVGTHVGSGRTDVGPDEECGGGGLMGPCRTPLWSRTDRCRTRNGRGGGWGLLRYPMSEYEGPMSDPTWGWRMEGEGVEGHGLVSEPMSG